MQEIGDIYLYERHQLRKLVQMGTWPPALHNAIFSMQRYYISIAYAFLEVLLFDATQNMQPVNIHHSRLS